MWRGEQDFETPQRPVMFSHVRPPEVHWDIYIPLFGQEKSGPNSDGARNIPGMSCLAMAELCSESKWISILSESTWKIWLWIRSQSVSVIMTNVWYAAAESFRKFKTCRKQTECICREDSARSLFWVTTDEQSEDPAYTVCVLTPFSWQKPERTHVTIQNYNNEKLLPSMLNFNIRVIQQFNARGRKCVALTDAATSIASSDWKRSARRQCTPIWSENRSIFLNP